MDESEILEDVPKVLEHLKKQELPMALGSASKNAVSILEKVKLLSYFDAVVDGTSVTKAKPDPEVFLIAASELGIDANSCVVFEDAVAGIEAAKNAGMLSIGIGDAAVLTKADHIFSNFTEISIDFLDSLIEKPNKVLK